MRGFRRHALSAAIPLLLLSWCGAAAAQSTEAKDEDKQDAKTLDSIVVTAERRSEPLQTTPIAATVLNGEDLQKWGVSVVDQLQFASPSATVSTRRSTGKRQCWGIVFTAVPPETMPTVVVMPRA